MRDFWKRFGWFWMSMVPALACVVLQITAVFQMVWTAGIVIAVRMAAAGLEWDQNELLDRQNAVLIDMAALGVLNYHVIGIGVFGMWYALINMGKWKPRQKTAAKFYVRSASLAVFIGLALNAFTSQLLEVAYYFVPAVIDDYAQLVDQSGMSTIYTMIAAVLLAPIGEELLCRGVIQHYAGKISRRFYVVNIVQALAFGAMHGNLVQGTYAFLLGLVLGWLRYRYDSLWVPMVIHFVVNLSSFLSLTRLLLLFPEHLAIDAALLLLMIGLTAGALTLVEKTLQGRRSQYKEI